MIVAPILIYAKGVAIDTKNPSLRSGEKKKASSGTRITTMTAATMISAPRFPAPPPAPAGGGFLSNFFFFFSLFLSAIRFSTFIFVHFRHPYLSQRAHPQRTVQP